MLLTMLGRSKSCHLRNLKKQSNIFFRIRTIFVHTSAINRWGELNTNIILDSTSPTNHKLILGALKAKLKEVAPQHEGTQKELNMALRKCLKLLETSFSSDISKAHVNVDHQFLNQIIACHLYREGLFDIGDRFVRESNSLEAATIKTHFLEMYKILEALKSRNLKPALSWATNNQKRLVEKGSDIEFKLHRLQYLQILQNRGKDEGLEYAKSFLAPLANRHSKEFQKLMACLLWAGNLDSSPYADLLSASDLHKLCDELERHYLHLMDQSCASPLEVTLAAGVQVLPTLLKVVNMYDEIQECQPLKQLAVPLDLGREFQFHLTFTCPVSADQACENNPPMLLSCGHVLCKQSISMLSQNTQRTFKCPYCPTQVEAGQCKQLYFR